MLIIKYTKAQYQAKITELEGYQKQLAEHLSKLQDLREKMFQFWDDPNARSVGDALNIEIRQVENAMARTTDSLILYRSSVESLSGADIGVADTISDALGILGMLGI